MQRPQVLKLLSTVATNHKLPHTKIKPTKKVNHHRIGFCAKEGVLPNNSPCHATEMIKLPKLPFQSYQLHMYPIVELWGRVAKGERTATDDNLPPRSRCSFQFNLVVLHYFQISQVQISLVKTEKVHALVYHHKL